MYITRRSMLVQRNGVYDHWCELPKATRDALLNAPSMGQYFNANIKADDRDENRPYDGRTHKVPSYQ